jgi:hypothetical protein
MKKENNWIKVDEQKLEIVTENELKKETINYIKKIIKENGSFSIGEFQDIASLPAVNQMGPLVALAEHFDENRVEINIYDANGYTSDPICNSYYLPYEELSLELLDEIQDLCDNWDAKNYQNICFIV